jgi:hypothetical protein
MFEDLSQDRGFSEASVLGSAFYYRRTLDLSFFPISAPTVPASRRPLVAA